MGDVNTIVVPKRQRTEEIESESESECEDNDDAHDSDRGGAGARRASPVSVAKQRRKVWLWISCVFLCVFCETAGSQPPTDYMTLYVYIHKPVCTLSVS